MVASILSGTSLCLAKTSGSTKSGNLTGARVVAEPAEAAHPADPSTGLMGAQKKTGIRRGSAAALAEPHIRRIPQFNPSTRLAQITLHWAGCMGQMSNGGRQQARQHSLSLCWTLHLPNICGIKVQTSGSQVHDGGVDFGIQVLCTIIAFKKDDL
ncbi:hypothetical protein B0H19DRAFT_1227936 [Mycena capillaripes]|nr:hypothetical protein B0H19DRAFT_1227936 [Mycena capillaripes]